MAKEGGKDDVKVKFGLLKRRLTHGADVDYSGYSDAFTLHNENVDTYNKDAAALATKLQEAVDAAALGDERKEVQLALLADELDDMAQWTRSDEARRVYLAVAHAERLVAAAEQRERRAVEREVVAPLRQFVDTHKQIVEQRRELSIVDVRYERKKRQLERSKDKAAVDALCIEAQVLHDRKKEQSGRVIKLLTDASAGADAHCELLRQLLTSQLQLHKAAESALAECARPSDRH